MTRSHGWRWSNTLYTYKEDLLWVWTGWGVLIISTNWESTFCTHDIHSQVIESKYQGVAASIWPIATVAGAELHYICIKKTCYEYEGDVECLDHNIQHDKVNSYLTVVNPIIYHAGVASLWPLPAVAGAEMHYIYTNLIFYEYEVDGMPQSWPTIQHR